MSHVAYDEVGRDFDAVRDRRPDAQTVWCERLRRYLRDPPPPAIVDVGSGTGIWSKALADRFGCRVHAVEPSDGMRAREADYWIRGRPRAAITPRWSLMRDVLHWTD